MSKTTTQEGVAEDSLANINQDGSITKLVVGPIIVVVVAIAVIAIVRIMQRGRERAEMEASLRE